MTKDALGKGLSDMENDPPDKKKRKKANKKSADEVSKREIFDDYKYQVYQQAVEKVYKEGKIAANEEMVLESMRDTLDIPYEIHEKIIEVLGSGQVGDKPDVKGEPAEVETEPKKPKKKAKKKKEGELKRVLELDEKQVSDSLDELSTSVAHGKIKDIPAGGEEKDEEGINAYKKALELTLVDGEITQKELGILSGLREALGISLEEHNRLEQETRENIRREKERKRLEAERTEKRKNKDYRINEDRIIFVENQIKKSRKTGVEITEPSLMVVQARKSLEDAEFGKVKKIIADAKKSLLMQKKIKITGKKIERLETMLKKANNLGVDTTAIKLSIDDCRESLNAGDFKEFDKQSTRIKNILQNLLKGKSSLDQIKKTELLVEKVKNLGVDCSNVELLLEESKKNLESGNLAIIKKKMTRARNELRDLERYKKSDDLIISITKTIDEHRKKEIDVKQAQDILKNARGALESKEFSKIPKIITQIRSSLKDAETFKETSDLINDVEALMNEVKEIGAKVTNAEEFLKRAKNSFKKNNLASAQRNANTARQSALDARENFMTVHAKNKISTIKLLIDEASEFGADVTEPQKALELAEKSFKNNNYKELNAQLTHAEELAKSSLDAAKSLYLAEKTSVELTSVEDFINESKKRGVDVSKAEECLKNSDELLNDGKYEELEQIIKDAREYANQALYKFQVAHANEFMSSTETLISEAKELGLDVNEAEDLLKEAESLFQEEDFDTLEKYLTNAENITKTRFTEYKAGQASEAISSTQSLIEESRELGIDVGEAEQLLLEAESQFKDEDYDAVEDFVKRAESIAKSSWDDYRAQLTMDTIKGIEAKLDELKSLNVDITNDLKTIEQAKAKFKEKEFDEADDILKDVETSVNIKLKDNKLKEIKRLMDSTKETISDAKEKGADVASAEKLFKEAQEMFDEGEMDISVLFESVKKANELAVETHNNFINLSTQDAITSAGQMIKELKDTGVDVSDAEDLLKQAEELFQDENFSGVDEVIKKAESSALDSQQTFFSEKYANDILITQRLIMDVKDMGGDVTKPMEELDLADKFLKNNDFETAEEHLEKSKTMLNEIKEQQVIKNAQKRVDNIERSIGELKNIGVDTSEVEALIKNARGALKNEDYKELNNNAVKAEEIITKSKQEFMSKEISGSISNLQQDIDETKALGTDIAQAQSLLERAKEFLDREDFSEARSTLEQAQQSIELSRKDYFHSNWSSMVDATKKIISETRSMGADTSEPEKVFAEAVDIAKKGDLVKARELLNESDVKIKELFDVTMVERTEKSMKRVDDLINKTKDLGVELSNVVEMFTSAQAALDQKEYNKVQSITGDIEKKVNEQKTAFINQRIEDEISPIKKDLEEAREIGATVRDAEEYIDTAVNSFNSGEFDKALKFVERAKNFIIRSREKVIKENHPKIDVTLTQSQFQDNDWNKLALHLENTGLLDAKDVRLILSGDDAEFREPPTIPLLKVGQSMDLEVGVKPGTSGSKPFGMKLFYYRDFDDNEYTFEKEKEFDVKPQGSYVIEDVFLTYQNGLLIAHETRKLNEDVQEDVFTSMLAAVQDFVKDSFYSKSKLDLNRLDFGDSKILIEKGKFVSIAVVLVGYEPDLLPLFMREIIREIEDTYIEVLDDWDGVIDELEGTSDIIKRLLDVSVEGEGDAGSLPNSNVSTIYSMAKNIKEMGGDPAEMEFLLESAIKSGSEGDFSSAWEFMDQAEEKGKIFMSEAFVESKKIIENARETGLEVESTSKELETALKHFRDGDYEKANMVLKHVTPDIRELQTKSQRVMYNEQITIFEESLTEMENDGVDISGPKAYLLMAKSAFDEENYGKIENFLSRGQDEFISLKNFHQQDKVNQSIERAESILTNVKNLGVSDTSRIEEITHMLERARAARDENDFDKAVEYAVNARKSADSLIKESNERDSAEEALDAANSVINASKQAGVDVSSVEDLFKKSKNAFDSGDYISTKTLTNDISNMMDKLRKPFQTQITSNTIFSAQSLITEAKEYGADVKEAEEILKEAKTLFESEDFEQAEIKANEAIESARIAKRKKQADELKTPLEDGRALISNVQRIGADVSDAMGYLQEAEESLHKLELESADELIKRAVNVAEDARDKYLMDIASEAITLSEKQLEEAEQLGVDITDPKRILTQAMEMFEDHEYIKAEQYASNSSDLLEEMKEKFGENQALGLYRNAGELASEIETLGADTASAQAHLKLADEAFGKRDYGMLKTLSQNAIDILIELKKPFQEKISKDAIDYAKNQIKAAKSFGVDITEAENLLIEARNFGEQKIWDLVEKRAKESAKIAEQAKNIQYENQIRTEINQLRGDVVQYESSGIDTTEVTQYLQKAEIALDGKNYTNVGKFLKVSREWVKKASEKKNKEKVLEIINYSKALVKYIKNNLPNITKEIKPAETQLQNAKKAFKAKKYVLAEKTALASKELVEKIKHPNLEQFLFVFKSLQTEEMLNSVRNIISDLNKKHIDTQEIKTFLKKAEFAFESDESYDKGKDYIVEAKLKSKDAIKKYLSKQASKAISTAQSQIISVKRMGVNISEAEAYLEKSKIAYKAQEFEKSKIIAEKVILALKKAKLQKK